MNPDNLERRELLTIEEYMSMSAAINYQLSPDDHDNMAILAKIFDGKEIRHEKPLSEAIKLVLYGYAGKRRRLGPYAVIHPLRVAALLIKCMKKPTLLDLLGAILHDLDEDLTPQVIGQDKWEELQKLYRKGTLSAIDTEDQWFLGERKTLYTRDESTPYYQYLGHILDHAQEMPDLLHVKLADRLDNTMDTHVYLPGVSNYNFYRFVFDMLFVPDFPGMEIKEYHTFPKEKAGVQLLSQLYKNTLFLNLIRQAKLDHMDKTVERLFNGLAVASIREAQWIALEVFSSMHTNLGRQRELLIATMEWCHNQKGVKEVRAPQEDNLLDGTFLERFALARKKDRNEQIGEIFLAKDQLAEVIIGFIATFSSFLNIPDFYVQGIERSGIFGK